jgi:hypothetical protein
MGVRGPGMMKPGVFGKVTAVNGNIITLSGNSRPMADSNANVKMTPPTPPVVVIYTVDATNATVRKNNATSTVSSVLVGDTLFAQGTVSGTNVTATAIIDGVMGRTGGPGMNNGKGLSGDKGHATSTPAFVGNGQPVIAGTISAVSGNTLTVTTTSNVTYTVDATNAKILEGNATASVGSLVVGHKVLVQGAVNGTSIVASTVVDQSAPAGNPPVVGKGEARKGFFGGVGDFFRHLFGF